MERGERHLTFSKSKFSKRLVGSWEGSYYLCWPHNHSDPTRTSFGSWLCHLSQHRCTLGMRQVRVSKRRGSIRYIREGFTRERRVHKMNLEPAKVRLCPIARLPETPWNLLCVTGLKWAHLRHIVQYLIQ